MTDPVREGQILAGKYRVERVMAQGGMGVVVAAIHQQLDQRVALKFMLPKDAPSEADYGRFMREAKAAVRLRSEHVAKVLDVGTAESGSPYIVMEYLEGLDLDAVLSSQGPLDVELAVTYVLQACEAVAEAHALGIVHRDLKPANLFLTSRTDGTPCVKVLDFGISKLLATDERVSSLTKTSAMMGTPIYMAPEQIRSSKDVDRRSDIWAIGMILYELLTGRTAFVRDTLLELCSSILTEAPKPPHELRADIPDALSASIVRALAKEPQARFPSLAELVTAIAPFSPMGYESAARVQRILGGGSSPSLPSIGSAPRIPAATRPDAPHGLRLATPTSQPGLALAGDRAFGESHTVAASSAEVAEPARPSSPSSLPTSTLAKPRTLWTIAVALGAGIVLVVGLTVLRRPAPTGFVGTAPSLPSMTVRASVPSPIPSASTLPSDVLPSPSAAASHLPPSASPGRPGPSPLAARPHPPPSASSASSAPDPLAPFGPRK